MVKRKLKKKKTTVNENKNTNKNKINIVIHNGNKRKASSSSSKRTSQPLPSRGNSVISIQQPYPQYQNPISYLPQQPIQPQVIIPNITIPNNNSNAQPINYNRNQNPIYAMPVDDYIQPFEKADDFNYMDLNTLAQNKKANDTYNNPIYEKINNDEQNKNLFFDPDVFTPASDVPEKPKKLKIINPKTIVEEQTPKSTNDDTIPNSKVNLDFFPRTKTDLDRAKKTEIEGFYQYFYGVPTEKLSREDMIRKLYADPNVKRTLNKNKQEKKGTGWK